MKQVHILALVYDINFRDSDEGDCCAGEGRRSLAAYKNRDAADADAAEFGPAFEKAEKETFVGPFSKLIKKKFGYDTEDFHNGYNFKLIVNTFEVQ